MLVIQGCALPDSAEEVGKHYAAADLAIGLEEDIAQELDDQEEEDIALDVAPREEGTDFVHLLLVVFAAVNAVAGHNTIHDWHPQEAGIAPLGVQSEPSSGLKAAKRIKMQVQSQKIGNTARK
jgi:hypothetical protein